MTDTIKKTISDELQLLYQSNELLPQIEALIKEFAEKIPGRSRDWSEKDQILISYGDSIHRRGEAPLATLDRFVSEKLERVFSGVHILPFFPYSSDDGFSVIDFYQVDYHLGSWTQVEQIAQSSGLMADLVLNHCSRQNLWFIDFVSGRGTGRDFFIEADPEADYSQVVRPRTHPLVVDVYTHRGRKSVWATFSADQVDLNYKNPRVLLEMLRVLLSYMSHGASYIRLDAVAFLWKELGTSCIHLPQTHGAIRLMRAVAEAAAPGTKIITETNVPHRENVSYFGQGDEAHLVYNFALPPLLVHGLNRGTSRYLTSWAKGLEQPPPGCSFFNFIASHDGIGLRAVEGIIPSHEITDLIESVHAFGGYVSMKSNGDGSKSPYELNISLFDMLGGTRRGVDEYQVDRFICAHAIALAFLGIPGVYIHSMTATKNDHTLVEQTGRTRSINRHRWNAEELYGELAWASSSRSQVFERMKRLLSIRKNQAGFHPEAPMEVLEPTTTGDGVFTFVRTSLDQGQTILCAFNLTNHTISVESLGDNWNSGHHGTKGRDLWSQELLDLSGNWELKPYGFYWLQLD